MLSYHNNPDVKAKYVGRFAAHRAMDQVIQGTGFNNGRGCFVGCTLDNYDHSLFPVELGWPEWLARLADRIFEGLPKSEAPQFGTDLLDAVQVGKNLEPVRHMLAVRRLDRLTVLLQGLIGKRNAKIDEVLSGSISAMAVVRSCHEAEIGGNSCDWLAAREGVWVARRAAAATYAAADAADAAADAYAAAAAAADADAAAAAYAADAAADAAYAADAAADAAYAYAAAAAADAAAAAADAAADAAAADADAYAAAYADAAAYAAAARKKSYQAERDDLLDILRTM